MYQTISFDVVSLSLESTILAYDVRRNALVISAHIISGISRHGGVRE
jgi:hypothetical protein